jgi:ribosome biogenesis GTPase
MRETKATGRIVWKGLGIYHVESGSRTVICSISAMLRKELVYPIAHPTSLRRRVVAVEEIRAVDPIAIGDEVVYADTGGGRGQITEVLPRRNKLSRRAAGKRPLEQVIVANVDKVVPVFAAAKPALKWRLLDRHLADAEAVGIPAEIVINKMDLVDAGSLDEEVAVYERIGYPVHRTSAVTGQGVEDLVRMLAGSVSVLTGISGVGKTTLLNRIQPGLELQVAEVSGSTGKGRHTTTSLRMVTLDCGARVVDTPGMREFGLWQTDGTDVAMLFRELRPYVGQCRFGLDCRHEQEPGCAMKEAVRAGEVSEMRFRSYLRLRG